MNGQTLKFNDAVVNRKEFHATKQTMVLNLVDADKILVSDKFKHINNGSKCFIAYLIIMSGYIKYFDDGQKNMSFKIKDESVSL